MYTFPTQFFQHFFVSDKGGGGATQLTKFDQTCSKASTPLDSGQQNFELNISHLALYSVQKKFFDIDKK
jgi:hypothetical protein